jgi:hypothetical protein
LPCLNGWSLEKYSLGRYSPNIRKVGMPGWGEPAFLLSRHFPDVGRGTCAN